MVEMKFKYLKFSNYRPYYGEQVIYFDDQSNDKGPYKKNIVLIGGLNGAGKTSLINAIYICFYGRRKFQMNEYNEILKNAINKKYLSEGGKESIIELGIQDNNESYAIQVNFRLTFNDIEETRKIFILNSDGEKIREVANSEHEFNDFIDQRIPIDVAPFFIFDAEKIRDLVGEHDKKETIDAIHKIVSLTLYNQLLSDLNHIYKEDSKKITNIVKNEEINKKFNELKQTVEEFDNTKKEESQLTEKINQLVSKRSELEQIRRKKIAESSLTKQQINRVLGNKENELEEVERKIEEYGRDALPKIILAPLIQKLKDRIIKEKEYLNAKSREKDKFEPFEYFMERLLQIELFPPLLSNQKKKLYSKGKDIWAEYNHLQNSLVKEDLEILHDLSHGDYKKLINYDLHLNFDISKLIDKRYKLNQEIEQLKQDLGDAPEEIDTSEEDEELKRLTEMVGSLRKDRHNIEAKLGQLRQKQINLRNEISRKQELMKSLGPIDKKIQVLNKLINALHEFIDNVTVLKAEELKVEIENILNSIFRKSDFSKITFDSKDYTLRIYDENNEEIDLLSRSEGEKQLIALSMIWALTKVSDAEFPFVIDTPLARLDSIHRKNIVDYYFTNLSDQVIILSTDTEITEDFLKSINPYLHKSYVLEYDDNEKITRIREGYFNFEKVI
jgi:DNA sulfur modification protein DndD